MKEINSMKIINKIEEKKQDIKKYGVEKIGLFGSFAKGKQHKKSDIDILVTFNNVNFDSYMDLKFMLERLLKRKVDLVIMENLKYALKNVKNEAIYAKL